MSNFITQALRGRPITLFGTCTRTRSSGYVDDLERCFWGDADDDPGRLTIIGNDLEVSVLEVALPPTQQGMLRGRPADRPQDKGRAREARHASAA